MIEPERDAAKSPRIHWVDNLRTFMVFLVVLLHAGLVYERSGGGALFWIVDDPATTSVPDILSLILDIFVMSVLFFVSGYLTPLSLKAKSGWAFLGSKFRRLMIPWMIAVLTLMPLYKFIYLFSRNIPQESWTTYFHWSNGVFSQSWLWFLPVLFVFDAAYFLMSRSNIDLSVASLKGAVAGAFVIGLINLFGMDILKGKGWTKTIWINFQNERLLIYFLVFLLGALCFKTKAFEANKENKKLFFVLSSAAGIPVAIHIPLLLRSGQRPGRALFSGTVDSLLLHLTFLLSLLGLLYMMINGFRFFLNRSGRASMELSRNSYGVYIIHVIVLGGIALTMIDTAIPSPLKFVILTIATYAACNGLLSVYRRCIRPRMSRRERPALPPF